MMIRIMLFCFFAFSFAIDASEWQCFKYEPAVVILSGTIKKVVFPGPPNYEDIRGGDTPESYWVLYLDKSICVDANPKDELNETESNVMSLQLNLSDYVQYKYLLGQKVVVRGRLSHSISGHHHTKVLIDVQDIKSAPSNAHQPTSAQ